MKNKKKGFTLVELIVVIAIVAILAAIAVPTTFAMINRSKDQKAQENVTNLTSPLRTAFSEIGLDSAVEDTDVSDVLIKITGDFTAQKAKYDKGTFIKVTATADNDTLQVVVSAPGAGSNTKTAEFGVKVVTAPSDSFTVTTTVGDNNAWGAPVVA